jgi:hypothetical protein
MLISWGSSSRLVLRRILPTLVTRGSLVILCDDGFLEELFAENRFQMLDSPEVAFRNRGEQPVAWGGAHRSGDPERRLRSDDEVGDPFGVFVHPDQQHLPAEVAAKDDVEQQVRHYAADHGQSENRQQTPEEYLIKVLRDHGCIGRLQDPDQADHKKSHAQGLEQHDDLIFHETIDQQDRQ